MYVLIKSVVVHGYVYGGFDECVSVFIWVGLCVYISMCVVV